MSQLSSPKRAIGASLPGLARLATSRIVLCVTVLALVSACGGSKGGTPTAPTNPAASVPPVPSGLTVGALVMKDRTAAISWGASAGATEYVVEVGSTAGGTDGGTQSAGTATSFTLRDLRAGRSHVRIKARNGSGTSAASAEQTFVLPDLGDYVEAIFLASGPLRASQSPGCGTHGRWSSFPRGTTVRNLVSAQIPAPSRDAIRVVLDQVAQATGGSLAATFEVVADGPRTVGVNEMAHVALQATSEIQFACGSIAGIACTTNNSPIERGGPFSGGLIRWSVAYYVLPNIQSTGPYAHESGHGVLGMCHIDGDGIGGSQQSLMSGGGTLPLRLTPFDIEALQAVYGSSLAIGANRADFVAAGLVRP